MIGVILAIGALMVFLAASMAGLYLFYTMLVQTIREALPGRFGLRQIGVRFRGRERGPDLQLPIRYPRAPDLDAFVEAVENQIRAVAALPAALRSPSAPHPPKGAVPQLLHAARKRPRLPRPREDLGPPTAEFQESWGPWLRPSTFRLYTDRVEVHVDQGWYGKSTELYEL